MTQNERLYPPLTSYNFLVLRKRRELLQAEVKRLGQEGAHDLILVDVGGNDKPYEPLFAPIVSRHLSLDLTDRRANVYGAGEAMPFASCSVDLVLCTQVLEHVVWPQAIVDEISRVLKPGGLAFVSVPAVYPLHGGPYDNWRFMAGGLRLLMRDFSGIRIMPEGGTVSGFFRTMNIYLDTFTGCSWGRPLNWALRHTLMPLFNLAGWFLDPLLRAGDSFAVNWLAVARK